jgi:hypothetical protein
MLDVLWILLFITAFVLIIIIADLEYHEYPIYWCLMLTLLDVILWFLLAGAVFEIEIPYELYNISSGAIETGTHTFSSKVSPEVSLFCTMMAISLMGYSAYAFLSSFKELYNERTGKYK